MSALDALQSQYDDASSSEEDSERVDHLEASENSKDGVTVKSSLPLPNAFKKDEKAEKVERDALGRVRTFGHVRGNWASYIFIPFEEETISKLVSLVKSVVQDYPIENGRFYMHEEFHLSLTKTQILRYLLIKPMNTALTEKFYHYSSFTLCLDEFEVYLNDEKTRSFIGMKVYNHPTLISMVQDCDKLLLAYNLDTYYKNPSFHISLAWSVDFCDINWIRKNILSTLNANWKALCTQDPTLTLINVKKVQFKAGNMLSEFHLQ